LGSVAVEPAEQALELTTGVSQVVREKYHIE
jgi:hypothetical protein